MSSGGASIRDFADPLELNARSHLGVPGLVEALRGGGVLLANALGSGVVEAPALMSFLPRLCQRLLGEDLRLPNVATWWCGQKPEQEDVIAYLDGMAITGAYGNPVLDDPPNQALVGAALSAAEKKRLIAEIRQRGIDFVGQEVVKSVDHARLGQWQADAAAFRSARLCGAHARTAGP